MAKAEEELHVIEGEKQLYIFFSFFGFGTYCSSFPLTLLLNKPDLPFLHCL